MIDLQKPLTDDELSRLDTFLLERIDEDTVEEGIDEGVLCVSELDGLLTALVSGPVSVPPSKWLPAVWGDCEPVWESEAEFTEVFSIMVRLMNSNADVLMHEPERFEPIFLERKVAEETHTIVDEWCEGYLRGVELSDLLWASGGEPLAKLLAPIAAFTSKTDWLGHDHDPDEVTVLQRRIAPKVREIHAYWLSRRDEFAPPTSAPLVRDAPKIGRNDPCPCGSGKKFKRCCLH